MTAPTDSERHRGDCRGCRQGSCEDCTQIWTYQGPTGTRRDYACGCLHEGLAQPAWATPHTHRITLKQLQAIDFWTLVDVRGEDDCWLFKRNTNDRRPIVALPAGVTGIGTVHYLGSRAAKALTDGRLVPRHLVVDHLCFNPPCVNPKHLDVVTQRTNLRRRRMVTA